MTTDRESWGLSITHSGHMWSMVPVQHATGSFQNKWGLVLQSSTTLLPLIEESGRPASSLEIAPRDSFAHCLRSCSPSPSNAGELALVGFLPCSSH
jgi:hypothetical protein